MGFFSKNKRVFNIFLLISLAGFLVLPKIILADDFKNITLKEIEKYLSIPEKEVNALIRSLINLFNSEWINQVASPYATAEAIAVPNIMREAVRIQALNHLLIEAPLEVTGKIIKGAIEISSIFLSPNAVAVALDKFEKETVQRAIEYGMSVLFQNEVRVTPGAIDFKYISRKGEKKIAPFQYVIIYQPSDPKRGEILIRFYSSNYLEPPRDEGSIGMTWGTYTELDHDLPPFIVDIRGTVEDYKWVGKPSIDIDFPAEVPDLGIKPLSRWEKYFLNPIKTTIKDVEVIITRVTGREPKITERASEIWNKIKASISKLIPVSPAALVTTPEVPEIEEQPLTIKETEEGIIQEIEEPEVEPEKEEIVEVKPQPIEPKPKELTREERVAEIQEMLDDIAERVDVMNQEVAEITGTEIIEGELALEDGKGGGEEEEGEEGIVEEEETEEEEKEKEIEEEEIKPEEVVLCSISQSVTPQRNKVILNEVAWMGTINSANDEWIELKNISGSEINLSGWQLLDKDQQIKIIFPKGAKLLNNGFWLLERTDDSSVPNVTADLIYTGSLSNTNEALYLFDENCQLQDEVLADPDWPAGDNDFKRTMERKNNLEWQTSLNPGGTPRTENSSGYIEIASFVSSGGGGGPTLPTYPKILISEIQIAGIESQKDEFVELYNPNDSEVDLTDWYLQRKTKNATAFSTFAPKTLFSGKKIKGKNYFLIARQDSTFTPMADIRTTYPLTENNTLILKNPDREIVDEVNWGEIPAGLSYGRIWAEISQEYSDNFEIQTPTPKAKNQKDTIPPQVEITSSPPPLTNQTGATFTFQANEENCSFECQLDGQNWIDCQSPKEYQNLEDGQHTFSARATDLFSNISPTENYSWTIDTSIESPTISLFDLNTKSNFYTNQNEVGTIITVSGSEEGISWFLSEENVTPTVDGLNWLSSKPTTFEFSTPVQDGLKTVYLWSKDEAENVSELGNSDSIILDTALPASQISQLENFQTSLSFTLSWSGLDLTSGILDYDVQYTTSPSEGVWLDWLVNTTQTQAEFTGQDGFAYYFRSRARDRANNLGGWSETISTIIDATPPLISFKELSSFQPQLSFTLSWSGTDPIEGVTASGIDGFQLRYSEDKVSWTENEWTLETEYSFTGQDQHTYYFQVKARDKAGNETQWQETSTKISLPIPLGTVVINEIAWMGTKASIWDEWIELYNNTGTNIDLSGWKLILPDREIGLEGSILANDFYLLERAEKATNILADLIYGGEMISNNGLKLELQDSTGNLIDSVDCSLDWFAGKASPDYISMERIDSAGSGSDSTNWHDNNLITRNGLDAANNKINGTPKAENSVSKSQTEIFGSIPAFNEFDQITLTYLGSPYLIKSMIEIPKDKTLNIEEGVTLKMGYDVWIEVKGTLLAEGSENKKITFTSLKGERWRGIYFNSSQNVSKLNYCLIELAGFMTEPATKPAIRVENSNFTFKNSILEDFGLNGIRFGAPNSDLGDSATNSLSLIENSQFLSANSSTTAIYIARGNPTIKNSFFKGNENGILVNTVTNIDPLSPIIEGNNFEGNKKPIWTGNANPILKSNRAEKNDNEINGIVFHGQIYSNSPNFTWFKNDIPYVIETWVQVNEGGTLTINPGVVVKFKYSTPYPPYFAIEGKLLAEGTETDLIVFTAWQTSPAPGSWGGLTFRSQTQTSILKNVTISYGGVWNKYWDEQGLISVIESRVELDVVTAEYGLEAGLYLQNSDSLVSNSRFENNQIGVRIEGNKIPQITNYYFEGNSKTDIYWPNGGESCQNFKVDETINVECSCCPY